MTYKTIDHDFISRLCEKCHPASTLLAIITYSSVYTKIVKDQSPVLKLLDQMVLRVKVRLTRSLHEICILPTDIEKIQLRLKRNIPEIIATDVNLCLYTMQHTVEIPLGREGEGENEGETALYSLHDLQHNEKLADFARWRSEREQVKTTEQHTNEAEERSENVIDMWKQLREKLRH